MPESYSHTYRVVIASTRHLQNPPTAEVLTTLLRARQEKLGKIMVATIGCDAEPGKSLKRRCEDLEIPFVEFSVFFNSTASGLDKEVANMARHSALLDWGEEFHVFVAPSRMTTIEDLVQRVNVYRLPLTLYSTYGACIEAATKETSIRPL